MISPGEVKFNVKKATNKVAFDALSDILKPEVLHSRVPRLAEVAEARIAKQNMMKTFRALAGKLEGDALRYVAQIDVSIWSAILSVFARVDPQTGEPEVGYLYKWDADKGCIVLDRDFFFALIKFLEDSGYPCDMRGKRKIMTGYGDN